jgi:tetrahydromethanopterin S-methyltransferase subunit G
MLTNMPYLIAAIATVVGGSAVGRKHGALYGVLAGLAIFIAATLILVALGFGY